MQLSVPISLNGNTPTRQYAVTWSSLCSGQMKQVLMCQVNRQTKSPASNPISSIHRLEFQRCSFIGSWFCDISAGIQALQIPQNGWRKTRNHKRISASLFGVGAPEALVIGVVALIVFGPKGLAEVAKNAGKTLKQFQPTIRELQQVSQDFRSTLEQEIGLDELRQPPPYRPPPATMSPLTPPGPPTTTPEKPPVSESVATTYPPLDAPEALPETSKQAPKAYSSEDYARITEEQAKALVPEEIRKAAEQAAWGGVAPVKNVPVLSEDAPGEKLPSEPAKLTKELDSK